MNVDIVRLPRDLESALAYANKVDEPQEKSILTERVSPQTLVSQKCLERNPEKLTDAFPIQDVAGKVEIGSSSQVGPSVPTTQVGIGETEDAHSADIPQDSSIYSGIGISNARVEQYDDPRSPISTKPVSLPTATTMV
jgi:hypothetical protein